MLTFLGGGEYSVHDEILIQGDAQFSSCGSAELEIIWNWQQIGGMTIPSELLNVGRGRQGPVIFFDSLTLHPSDSYKFRLSIELDGSGVHQSSQSVMEFSVRSSVSRIQII